MTNARSASGGRAYRYAFAAIVLALATACSRPTVEVRSTVEAADPAVTLAAVMQADRDFAAAAAKDGLKTAFLAWLDAEGEFIDAGGVVKGAATIAAGFEPSPHGFAIAWAPDGGHAAAAGDFATTTGRYTVKADGAEIEKGRYLSVWRKDSAGAWKVVTDVTVADRPAPREPDPEGRPG